MVEFGARRDSSRLLSYQMSSSQGEKPPSVEDMRGDGCLVMFLQYGHTRLPRL